MFREVRRVLRRDGTLWLNLGHTYAGYWGEKYAHKAFGKDRRADASTPPNKPSLDFAHSAIKPKDLIGIPWRVALALQADGWYLRSDVIWAKPNPSPESVRDRPTCAHEYLFLLSPSRRYYFDRAAIAEPCVSGPSDLKKMRERKDRLGGKHLHLDDPRNKADRHTQIGRRRAVGSPAGRNKRSVWTIATRRHSVAHFATFPRELITPCILAGTSAAGCCTNCGAPYRRVSSAAAAPNPAAWEPSCRCPLSPPAPCVVLDPFLGSGTTAAVARQLGRRSIGIELNTAYCRLAAQGLNQHSLSVSDCN
jgi:DNA modification methylase